MASSACRTEAGEPIAVFIDSPEPVYPRQLSGTLEAAEPPVGPRPGRLTIRLDDADGVEIVDYLFPDRDLAFPVGKHLDVTVEMVPGFPSYYGITVSDDRGLLLAAASDSTPGHSVLRNGVPGFEIRFRDAGCASRDGGKCYDEMTNLALELSHGSSTLALMQGETGEVDGFRVRCLVAEKIVYSKDCLDAGRVALSYLIMRSDLLDAN